MSDNDNPAAEDVRRLLIEAGRLAEQCMTPEQFVAEFMAVLQVLMVEQLERDERGSR